MFWQAVLCYPYPISASSMFLYAVVDSVGGTLNACHFSLKTILKPLFMVLKISEESILL